MIEFHYQQKAVPWWHKLGNRIAPDKFPIVSYLMHGSTYADRDAVLQAYALLNGVGYHVKRTDRPYGRELPKIGIVTDIDSMFVYVESEDGDLESYHVPRADFHDVYNPLIAVEGLGTELVSL